MSWWNKEMQKRVEFLHFCGPSRSTRSWFNEYFLVLFEDKTIYVLVWCVGVQALRVSNKDFK